MSGVQQPLIDTSDNQVGHIRVSLWRQRVKGFIITCVLVIMAVLWGGRHWFAIQIGKLFNDPFSGSHPLTMIRKCKCQCPNCRIGKPCDRSSCRDNKCTCKNCKGESMINLDKLMIKKREYTNRSKKGIDHQLLNKRVGIIKGDLEGFEIPWKDISYKYPSMYDFTTRLNTDHIWNNPRELCKSYTLDVYSNDCV